jgi:hypothetical protein
MKFLINFLVSFIGFFFGKADSQRGSFEITTAFVEGYRSNIMMLSQQMGSRLRNNMRNESQNSKAEFFERIGVVDAQEILDRHGDTPIMNTPHSRRMVTLRDAEYADLIDKMDRVRLLINPDDAYVRAAVASLHRFSDDRIIEAALGDARGGEDGSVSVPLPNSQKIACFDGTTTTGVNLNVKTLIAVSAKFDENEVDEMEQRYFVWGNKQKASLLNEDKATSSDYAAIKALVRGEIDTYMGFKFIRSERLPRAAADVTYTVTDGTVGAGTGTITAAVSRRCFAYSHEGMLFSTGQDVFARISERDDKRYSTQVYVAESVGATRMEEVKVVEVICSE